VSKQVTSSAGARKLVLPTARVNALPPRSTSNQPRNASL